MTLSRAFKERKRLANHIAHMRNMLNRSTIYHIEDGGKAELYEGKPLDEAYEWYKKCVRYLIDLNLAIDKANVTNINGIEGRGLLTTIERTKETFAIAMRLAERQENFKPVVKEYDNYLFNEQTQKEGSYKEVHFILDTEVDWKEEMSDLKKQIKRLENSLDSYNSDCTVSISTELYDFIESMYDC